jgi:hypothetical protein
VLVAKKRKAEDAPVTAEIVPVEASIPAGQVKDIVAAAVREALTVAQPQQRQRDADGDIRLVLRTADFLLRACGIRLSGNVVQRPDGAFYSDPVMVEGLRFMQEMMLTYGVSQEPVDRRERPAMTNDAPHADPYGDDWMLDHLEGGWGRR